MLSNLVLRCILFFALAFATITLPNGFRDINGDHGADLTTSTVSYEKALQLFDLFVSQENIPFGYTYDGCYARATAMTLLAESRGIDMAKLYVEGQLNAQAYYSEAQTQWAWHVVPVMEVEMPDGHHEILVFDPSLFDRPVTIKEFEKGVTVPYSGSTIGYSVPGYEFKPKIEQIYFGSRYQYLTFESLKNSWQVGDLVNSLETLKSYKTYQQGYPPLDELKKEKGNEIANRQSQSILVKKLEEMVEDVGNPSDYRAKGNTNADPNASTKISSSVFRPEYSIDDFHGLFAPGEKQLGKTPWWSSWEVSEIDYPFTKESAGQNSCENAFWGAF